MDIVNLYHRQKHPATRVSQWLLSAYLGLFFVWLLPAHVLSHEPSSFSTQRCYAQSDAVKGEPGHDPDNCQLCRNQGELGALPLCSSLPLVSSLPSVLFQFSESTPSSVTPDFALLRAPPASFLTV
jgi:hypothetical protein